MNLSGLRHYGLVAALACLASHPACAIMMASPEIDPASAGVPVALALATFALVFHRKSPSKG